MTIPELQELKSKLMLFEVYEIMETKLPPNHQNAEEMLQYLVSQRLIFQVAQRNIQTFLNANEDVKSLINSTLEIHQAYFRVHAWCMNDVIGELDKKVQCLMAASKIEYPQIRALQNQITTLTGCSPSPSQIEHLQTLKSQIEKKSERPAYSLTPSSTPLVPLGDEIGGLPSEAFQHVLSYCGGLDSLQVINRQFRQAADSLLEHYWFKLRKSPPPGIVDIAKAMQSIEKRLPNQPYSILFQALQREFVKQGATPYGFPVTQWDFEILQIRAKILYDQALQAMWFKIAAQHEDLPALGLSTGDEIKDWLNDPANAPSLSEITGLDLQDSGLFVLPSEIGKLTALQVLILSRNHLVCLPDSICDLTQLQALSVMGNNLTSLPNSIGQLTGLLTLSLQNNKLISLPDSILNLPHFLRLALNGNNLIFLPDSMLNSQNPIIRNNPVIIDRISELQYPSKSALAMLYQLILQKKGDKEIKAFFSSLALYDRNLIMEMVWDVSGRPETMDIHWGEHHVFSNMTRFCLAVRQAIRVKLERLLPHQKSRVYKNIHQLAGSPEPDNWQWGETHALYNLPRLADAMDIDGH